MHGMGAVGFRGAQHVALSRRVPAGIYTEAISVVEQLVRPGQASSHPYGGFASVNVQEGAEGLRGEGNARMLRRFYHALPEIVVHFFGHIRKG
jgi:hypothetical protein